MTTNVSVPVSTPIDPRARRAEGPWSDLALHSIGWKAFQDLCSQICEVVLKRPVEIFQEAQDDGQDAVFLLQPARDEAYDVGTVQCKYSANSSKKLRSSDITAELANISALVANGQAHTYVLMTSMSVDARVAGEIRSKLKLLGVKKPHVLGRQYIVRAIKTSAHLRALVPQVYGLGDLSIILDQRFVHQTRALLGHWLPKLKLYVTTSAHRDAVKALNEHGIVLLLGNPSAGKSAIGAILSTIASEDMHHTVLSLTSPRDFELHWNPDDPKRFFWIDDAFGANVVREEYVQDWATIFRKVQAAIGHGNKFLLTSRRYIYEAARYRLGNRNLTVFINKSAVIDVGNLTLEEKTQILYNHIRFGAQPKLWKRAVKRYLASVAAVGDFLPGVAERLGDPAFTKGLALTEAGLVRFMSEPREHLVETINALDERLRAGLILVYVHQGKLDPNAMDDIAAEAVSSLTGVALPRIRESLHELSGSFLRVSRSLRGELWQFAHPTISDALTEILRKQPYLTAALIHGAPLETILENFVCEEAGFLQGALVIPSKLEQILAERLIKAPDENAMNTRLFRFLAHRANDDFFRRTVEANPDILERVAGKFTQAANDPTVCLHARALRLGLLNDQLRAATVDRIEKFIEEELDLSFSEDEEVLALVPPKQLLRLGVKLRAEVLPALLNSVDSIADDASLEDEPESHFVDVTNAIETFKKLEVADELTEELLESIIAAMDDAVADLQRRKDEKEAEEESDQSESWDFISTASRSSSTDLGRRPVRSTRSIFDDVDE